MVALKRVLGVLVITDLGTGGRPGGIGGGAP